MRGLLEPKNEALELVSLGVRAVIWLLLCEYTSKRHLSMDQKVNPLYIKAGDVIILNFTTTENKFVLVINHSVCAIS